MELTFEKWYQGTDFWEIEIVPGGNDCIPWDATVLAMSKLAQGKGFTLEECSTYTELPPSFAGANSQTSVL